MTGKKVDWDKVRRAHLEGVVVGGLSKATRPQVLEVSFLTPDAQRAWRERYTVVNGRISSAHAGRRSATRWSPPHGAPSLRPRSCRPGAEAAPARRSRAQPPPPLPTAGRDRPSAAGGDRPAPGGRRSCPSRRRARAEAGGPPAATW